MFGLGGSRNCVAIYKKGRLGDEQVWRGVRIRDSRYMAISSYHSGRHH